jgi:serine/threonine protein kinase
VSEHDWVDEPLSSIAARSIDAICEQFEAELRAGRRPQIQRFAEERGVDLDPDTLQRLLIPELQGIEDEFLEQGIPEDVATGEKKSEITENYASSPANPDASEAEDVNGPQTLRPETAADARRPTVAESSSRRETRMPEYLREYQILSLIGRGGMGAVYKARHTKLDRILAVKVLPPDLLKDETAVARFERENRAVGKLDHPNIVRATDAGQVDGIHFLVMDLVEGMDLSHLSRRHGPLPVAVACELMRQAADGLQHAHENGLVHRDIKPSNLMVTRGGEVKVLDFGLARLRSESTTEAELTMSGQIMGTWEYASPEQIADSQSVDIRADIYSLGCTLFKLLIGRSPYNDGVRNSYALMCAHTTEPIPPIEELRPDVQQDVVDILKRMLAKSAEDRFACPAEVAEALAPFSVEAELPMFIGLAMAGDAPTAAHVPQPTIVSALQSSSTGTLASEISDTELTDSRENVSHVIDITNSAIAGQGTPAGVVETPEYSEVPPESEETFEPPADGRRPWLTVPWIMFGATVIFCSIIFVVSLLNQPGQAVALLQTLPGGREPIDGWKFDGHTLTSPVEGVNSINFPLPLPKSYRLEMSVQREQGATLIVSASDEKTPWSVEFSSRATIVENDDSVGSPSKAKLVDSGWDLTRQSPSLIVITVRPNRIQVERDGAKVIEWEGEFASLAGSTTTKDARASEIILTTKDSEYRISDLRMVPLDE